MSNPEKMESLFPLRPEEPREEDCCGNGCSPCVFDIYRAQLLTWEQTCCNVLEGRKQQCEDVPALMSQVQYNPYQLVSVRETAHDTNIYRFQAVEMHGDASGCSNPVPIKQHVKFTAGQYFILRSNSESEGIFTRAYTPISSPFINLLGCFEVLIKLYRCGKMSGYVRNLKIGNIVYWRGPYGDFSYIRNKYKFVLMLCAGTGIAPMYSIAKGIVDDELDDTFVRLLFSCKTLSNILFRDEIRELSAYWNFTSCMFLTQDTVYRSRYGENFVVGRIRMDTVTKELAGKVLHSILVLICGTKSFNKDMLNVVQQAGVPQWNVCVF